MRCLLCGGGAASDNVCPPCLDGLPWNDDACPGCGLPLAVTEKSGGESGRDGVDHLGQRCAACRARPPPWDAVVAALRYDFPADRLVRRLKFGHDPAAGRVLAAAMCRHPPSGDEPRHATDHVPPTFGVGPQLVPVPLHWFRHWRRGYNQAAELGLHLRAATGWAMIATGLRRTRHTRAQSGLGARARRRNLGGAFAWHGPPLAECRVVLVDDVMTTGTTVGECADTLKRAGAGRVDVWVAARAVGAGQSASSAHCP